jgi:hypothetical protein
VNKIFYLSLGLLFLYNCSSSYAVVQSEEESQNIALQTTEFSLGDTSKWFSVETQGVITSSNLTEESGNKILGQVITGYENQIGEYQLSDDPESAYVVFNVKEVSVKRGRFTFNFLKPGPIYVMEMKADIIINGKVVSSEVKKAVVNMASVNFPEEPVKFMRPSEKRKIEYQLEAFRIGLRKLYQSLYFDAFDISLRL